MGTVGKTLKKRDQGRGKKKRIHGQEMGGSYSEIGIRGTEKCGIKVG